MDFIVENVSKKIKSRQILKNISMHLESGQCIGLVGPNGAGKTSLTRTVLGLYACDQGQITFDGKNISELDYAKEEERVCFLLDTAGLMRMLTVEENIEFFYRYYNKAFSVKQMKKDIEKILDDIKLTDYRKENIRNLSRGMKQRLAIGRTMVTTPKFFIMDEPYLGLDVEAQFFLSAYIKRLRENGCAILISAHDLGHLEKICDGIYFMKKGEIVSYEKIPEKCEKDYLENLYKKWIGIEG